jgi:hypothetical protein
MNKTYKDQFKPWTPAFSAINRNGLSREITVLIKDGVKLRGSQLEKYCVKSDTYSVNAIKMMIGRLKGLNYEEMQKLQS